MESGDQKLKVQQANSIFEFEGYVNDEEEETRDRETAIDPIWEKQQKKVKQFFTMNMI